jgi:hypothetical protein
VEPVKVADRQPPRLHLQHALAKGDKKLLERGAARSQSGKDSAGRPRFSSFTARVRRAARRSPNRGRRSAPVDAVGAVPPDDRRSQSTIYKSLNCKWLQKGPGDGSARNSSGIGQSLVDSGYESGSHPGRPWCVPGPRSDAVGRYCRQPTTPGMCGAWPDPGR